MRPDRGMLCIKALAYIICRHYATLDGCLAELKSRCGRADLSESIFNLDIGVKRSCFTSDFQLHRYIDSIKGMGFWTLWEPLI